MYERLNNKVQACAFWGRNPAHEEYYCCMGKHFTNTSINLNKMLYILTFDEHPSLLWTLWEFWCLYGALIIECPKSCWHDSYKICPIYDQQIPEERNNMKKGFLRCHDCGAITHKTRRRWKPLFISPLKRRTKKMINFHPFHIAVYLTLFVSVCLSNKVF